MILNIIQQHFHLDGKLPMIFIHMDDFINHIDLLMILIGPFLITFIPFILFIYLFIYSF